MGLAVEAVPRVSWCRAVPWRALCVALVCGLAALLVMVGQLTLLVPGTQVVTDPREVITTLGAALTGPWGALLIGPLAGACEPTLGLAWVSMVQHTLACLWIALAYRRWVAPQPRLALRLGVWLGLVAVYYLVCFFALAFLPLLQPSLFARLYSGAGPWHAFGRLASGARIEFLLTAGVTTVMLYALPKRWRRPLA